MLRCPKKPEKWDVLEEIFKPRSQVSRLVPENGRMVGLLFFLYLGEVSGTSTSCSKPAPTSSCFPTSESVLSSVSTPDNFKSSIALATVAFGSPSENGLLPSRTRTLRRALNLAFKWGKLDKPVKIELASGERQRDRVVGENEIEKYLDVCPQPWRDCATIILDEGFRPSEVFALRWSHVFFNDDGAGLIQVVEGKSKAARRILPVTTRVYELLRDRHELCGCPNEGWIFPSSSECGHFNGDAAKDQHKKAITDSGVKPFVPYTLRHTALTKLGEKAGGNVFALASIAGHSSIAITQRYIHPQADAINQVFSASPVGTKLGTTRETPKLNKGGKVRRTTT